MSRDTDDDQVEPREDDDPAETDPTLRAAADAASDLEFDGWEAFEAENPEHSDLLRQFRRLQGIARGHLAAVRESEDPDSPVGQTQQIEEDPSSGGPRYVGDSMTTWGPLQLRELLGAGSSGDIYRAFDPQLQREVALKLQPVGPSQSERALAEARRLARVRHANVLSIHGADVFGGLAGIWTDLLHGETLEEKLRRDGSLDEFEAASIGIDLCRALHAVHRAGLVHGDVKAANVMSEDDGSIVLLDFGSGRVLAGVETPTTSSRGSAPGQRPDASRLEDTDLRISGTPLAMAPEVFFGATPAPVTDLYALAVMLYRLTTGTYPVLADTMEALVECHRRGERVPLADRPESLSDDFVETVDRCLAADPKERLAGAREMENALTRVLSRRTEHRVALRRATCPNNVPRAISSFVGRGSQVGELRDLIREHRLVSLTGTGGAGKTRLATETAASLLLGTFEEVRFVELAALTDPERILPAIGEAIGLRPPAHDSWMDTICSRFGDRDILLALDNCEHLVQSVAPIVKAFLERCPHLRILCTSREALRIFGETIFRVPPLELPDPAALRSSSRAAALAALRSVESVDLFLQRAQASGGEFELDDGEVQALIEICRRLDGIPLAIELAAVRAHALPLKEILTRLDRRFRLLASKGPSVPRHQTLSAMIDWSHELLDEPERTLFARLGVFIGGWTLEAAETVCSGGDVETDDVLDLLTRLVERNLVEVDAQRSRYRMLEMIHAYARQKLEDRREGIGASTRHRDYFAQLAKRAEDHLRKAEEPIWNRRVRADLENLRAALESCYGSETDLEFALEFAANYVHLSYANGNWREGLEVGERMLARPDGVGVVSPNRSDILRMTGFLHNQFSDFERTSELYDEALEISMALEDEGRIAATYGQLGNLAFAQSHLVEAKEFQSRAYEIAVRTNDIGRMAIALSNLGNVHEGLGDVPAARDHHERSIEAAREAGDLRSVAYSLCMLGYFGEAEDRFEDATRYYEESLALRREIGDLWGVSASISGLGSVLWRRGEFEKGEELIRESRDILLEIGDRSSLIRTMTNLALLHYSRKDLPETSRCLHEVVETGWKIGDTRNVAIAFAIIATVLLDSGEIEAAGCVIGGGCVLDETFEGVLPGPNIEHQENERRRLVTLIGSEEVAEEAMARGRAMNVEELVKFSLERLAILGEG